MAPHGLQSVKGVVIAKPRVTAWGWWYLFCFGVLPFLGAMLLLDSILWAVMRFGFNSCYGILCLL